MAFVHGKNTGVLVGAYDLSAFFNSAQVGKTVDAAEVTTFGKDDKVYLAGQEDGSLSLGGFFDGDAGAVDAVLAAAFAADTPVSVVWSGLATLGNVGGVANVVQTDYTVTSPVGDAVQVSASGQADGGVRAGGRLLAPLVARTSVAALTGVDDTAASTFGGVAHLHVTAFTGTNCTIKVQHSTDNSVWADLITFGSVTDEGSERAVASGTVNRYLRVNVTAGTFTSVTFAVVFARNRR
jgi:hypothetical protein